eukprot:1283403-Rhodomonas_salina.1
MRCPVLASRVVSCDAMSPVPRCEGVNWETLTSGFVVPGFEPRQGFVASVAVVCRDDVCDSKGERTRSSREKDDDDDDDGDDARIMMMMMVVVM